MCRRSWKKHNESLTVHNGRRNGTLVGKQEMMPPTRCQKPRHPVHELHNRMLSIATAASSMLPSCHSLY